MCNSQDASCLLLFPRFRRRTPYYCGADRPLTAGRSPPPCSDALPERLTTERVTGATLGK
jgi:hypothetical protein